MEMESFMHASRMGNVTSVNPNTMMSDHHGLFEHETVYGLNGETSMSIYNSSNDTIIGTRCFRLGTRETIQSELVRLLIMILYYSTSGIALIANTMVIVVQTYGPESRARANKSVGKLLINLAVADIVFSGFCVPITYTDFVYREWVWPDWLCYTSQFVQLMSIWVLATSLNIICIERYLATLYPLSGKLRWLQSYNNVLIGMTWVTGAAYAYYPLSQTVMAELVVAGEVYRTCSYTMPYLQRRIYITSNVTVTCAIPLCVSIFVHTAIYITLNFVNKNSYTNNGDHDCSGYTGGANVNVEASLPGQSQSSEPTAANRKGMIKLRKSRQHQSQTRTKMTMLAIVLLFAVCWAPVKTFQLLLDYDYISFCEESSFFTLLYIYMAAHWLAMASSFINPIVYSFMSQSFRNDFRRIVSSIFRRKKTQPGTNFEMARNRQFANL